ncbi:MAG: hypothetical protein K2W95_00760 [Candidatus Obscuribacterales bacterium]|nr:hypothetical protein [Candidatus Obscuribacterales bacterium]
MSRKSTRPVHPQIAGLLSAAKLAHVRALAEKIQLPEMTVHRILGNFNSHSHFLNYCKLAAGLGCSVDHLASIYLDHGQEEASELIRALAGEKTTRQLAEICDFSKSTAHYLLANESRHIQLADYRKIARGLYISLTHLASVLTAKSDTEDTICGALTDRPTPVSIHSVVNQTNIFGN